MVPGKQVFRDWDGLWPPERGDTAFVSWGTVHQYGFYAGMSRRIVADANGLIRIQSRIMGALAYAHYTTLHTWLFKVKHQIPTHSHFVALPRFSLADIHQCEFYRSVAQELLSGAKGLSRIPNIYRYLHSVAYLRLARSWSKRNTPSIKTRP